jgi:hypothetical protein
MTEALSNGITHVMQGVISAITPGVCIILLGGISAAQSAAAPAAQRSAFTTCRRCVVCARKKSAASDTHATALPGCLLT